ncbi:MAG: phosphatidate cytidylyltransferase [Melioribacteraceae bacterium]|nr:MAG: phosphatidate cytidylyltransferase [Melioribacteraceae bacterium]
MTIPLYNILIAAISVIYVFTVVAIMDFAVKKGFPSDISRKVIHIAAGCWLLFWYFFDDSDVTKYLNILPAAIWTILLLIKGISASPNDDAVKTMTRSGDKKELLRGPFYFTLVMIVSGTFLYKTEAALTAIGILAWGDGMAPVVGSRLGKLKYSLVTEKTLEGSLAFSVFGFLGAMLFNYFILGTYDTELILISVIVATIVEALSPKDLDNLLIPTACFIIYYLVY